ncbi:MAG: TMEM175 family protein [Terriglobales bacterium]
MEATRLTAFSDGFIAVIITIMVLGLRAPEGANGAALEPVAPGILIYALSFVYLGIYWNNHHHFYQLVERVDGGVLWANLHLMFWLSLVPFTTAWVGAHAGAPVPAAIYGASLFLPALAWWLMRHVAVAAQEKQSRLAQALGGRVKEMGSVGLRGLGIGLSFWQAWLGYVFYTGVALWWLTPDRRIELAVEREQR